MLFTYKQLALKELDQMNELVQSKISESQKAEGDVQPLMDALQAVFSRPDSDGMIVKVVGYLRAELDKHEAWEETVNKLAVEALNGLKNPKTISADVQVTYQVFLENLLVEMKPFADQEGFERAIVQKIRDAKVKISKESAEERSLRMLKAATSPSDLADSILKHKKPKKAQTPASPAREAPAAVTPPAK